MGVTEMHHHVKAAPSIRFKGFTEDWEQRKLGEITESYSGGTPSVANHSYYGGSIPFIRSAEINSINTELYLTEEGLNSSSAKLVEEGDILYALYGATSGEVGISQINGAINQAILAIKPKSKYDPNFIMQWLRRQKNSIISTYLQGGQGNLSGAIVKDLIISVPIEYDEQIRIGAFFKQLDNTIALHQRQLDNYKQLKKSMKQKIFDQELRFKDADGNDYPKWERRTLGEISKIIMGQSPDSANYTSNEQDTVLIQGNADLNGGRITPRIYTTQITKTCEAGDIILTVRAPVGDLAIANTRACIGRGVCAIKGDLYIYQYLEMIRDTDGWRKIIQGSTFESINSNDVKDLPIDVPSSEERKKIAEFFKALDRRIEKSTQRVESMKQFRKGLMQQMFVE